MGHHNSQKRASVKGGRPTTPPKEVGPTSPTREQILFVASNLFAAQGYHGTTTREIAEVVGIRQPSLFHHFESKAAIMGALLEEDLGRTVLDRERLARADEPASVRLYRYILREIRHIVSSRYNVAGIYSEEVRTSAELAPWYARRRRLHRAIDHIVRDGVSSGEFVDIPVDVVRASILGTLERALTGYSGGQAPFDPVIVDQITTLLLRALVVDMTTIQQIRETVNASEPVSLSVLSSPTPTAAPAHEPVISDAAWLAVSAAVPARAAARGGRWKDDRKVFEAIAWRVTNGSSWRDLPPRLGPWQTVWKRHAKWREDGTWHHMQVLAGESAEVRKELEWMFRASA